MNEHEEDARLFLAEGWTALGYDDQVRRYRLSRVVEEYLSLRQSLRDGAGEAPTQAFAALRAGKWDVELHAEPEPREFGPNTASGLCAICGPITGSVRQCWCRYDGKWWVFCLQCCDTWRSGGNGAGPSAVALLLEAALKERGGQ